MFLSVIVPTCNRYEPLSKCLRALSPHLQGLSPETYEIIVTDDSVGLEQKLRLVADFPGVIWNQGPRRGPASNRNSGAKASKGDWLIFIDDDCIPNPELLSAYREGIAQNPQLRVFEGAILEERPQQRMDEEAPINKGGGGLWSCNFMIKRDLFFELEGFCELFPFAAMEDVDLRERLKKKRIIFLFLPQASVIHPWRHFSPALKQFKVLKVSHQIYYARHPELRPTVPQTILDIIRMLINGLLYEGYRLRFRGVLTWLARTAVYSYLFIYLAVIIDGAGAERPGP